GVFDLSTARRAAGPARRYLVWRRAANARNWTRLDGGPGAPDPRRAIARALAALGRGTVCSYQEYQHAGHRRLIDRTERGAEPGSGAARLYPRQWSIRAGGTGGPTRQ